MNEISRNLFGRKQIFTNASEINKANVLDEIRKAMTKHENNRIDIEYLYNYYKGKQPTLYRTKDIRSDICNRIVENRANQIVEFKVGYLCGSPIQYVSTTSDDKISESIDKLNKYMRSESKENKDRSLMEWDMICGTAYRMCLPDTEYDAEDEDAPFEIYTLDPRNTFVIYSNDVKHRPLAGVYYTVDEDSMIKHISVYTKNEYFQIEDESVVISTSHALGKIPIIEYPANNSRLGAFEIVLPLLDALNNIDSNRVDGIEQFIQSLIVLYNCELPDEEDATTLQQKGIISLKSVGENKADITILSEQLNQSETQTLKADMYQTILEIVGMPSQGNGNTADSSNNGAVILKNGWGTCEARAKDSEIAFKESEQEFIKLVLRICRDLSDINLKVEDIDTHFTRRNYEALSEKTTVLTQMLSSDKIAPKLAFQHSGLFIDPEEAYRQSVEYMEEREAKAQERAEMFAQQNGEEDEEQKSVADGRAESSQNEDTKRNSQK